MVQCQDPPLGALARAWLRLIRPGLGRVAEVGGGSMVPPADCSVLLTNQEGCRIPFGQLSLWIGDDPASSSCVGKNLLPSSLSHAAQGSTHPRAMKISTCLVYRAVGGELRAGLCQHSQAERLPYEHSR